jgi:hypothetical protein
MTTEEKREYQKVWRLNHKDKVKEYQTNRKEYNREYAKIYRKNNPEKTSRRRIEWRANNKEHVKQHTMNYNLQKLYGITSEQYNQLLLKQNGCCAICNKPSTDYKRRLHVDHDHTTKKIRGLLCVRCNYGVGYFNEDTSLLDKAKEYLNTTK